MREPAVEPSPPSLVFEFEEVVLLEREAVELRFVDEELTLEVADRIAAEPPVDWPMVEATCVSPLPLPPLLPVSTAEPPP
jgi:hypothetical protein